MGSFREEFRFRKLGFQDVQPERFCVFQWRTPGLLFVIYRIVLAVYTLVWLSLTASQYQSMEFAGQAAQAWSAYLTNWTYVLLTIYFTLHALITIIVYTVCCGSRLRLTQGQQHEEHWRLFHELSSEGYEHIPSDDQLAEVVYESRTSLPWYFALVWILFNAASVGAVMVSLVFWAILVPGSDLGMLTNDNIQLHLINSVLILIEHGVTAVPIRLLHVVYPILYGVIYALFSVFYWVDDHSHVMYFILDWGKPGPTVGYVFLVGLVIIPLIHLVIFGLYRLKLCLFQRWCHD